MRDLRLPFALLICWLGLVSATPALATLTLGAISPYSFASPSSGTNQTLYYATDQCGTGTINEGTGDCTYGTCGVQVDTAAGFKKLNLCRTSNFITDSSKAAYANTDGLVEFTVATDTNIIATGTQVLAITIMVTSDSTTYAYVPIAYFNGTACGTAGNSSCNYISTSLGFSSVFNSYGVKYLLNGTNRIGVFLRDICKAFNEQKGGNITNACSGTTPVAVSDITHSTALGAGGVVANFKLRAFVTLADSETTLGRTDVSTTATDATRADAGTYGDFQVNVQGGAGWINNTNTNNGDPTGCPADAGGNLYYPADSSILVNTTTFNSVNYASSDSGITKIIALANQVALTNVSDTRTNATGVLPDSFRTGNSFATELSVSQAVAQKLDGFVNSTASEDHPYELWFGLRDNAGAFASMTGNQYKLFPCGATGVRAFPIEGFLRSGKCFIATAAYRDSEVWSVQLLRQFRDRVLMQSDWGREFVTRYYLWSPDAARWLLRHPRYELAVLIGLLPIQIFAYLMIQLAQNSIWVVVFAGAWALGFVLARRENPNARVTR